MKKRLISLLMILVMLVSLFPASVFAVDAPAGTAENPYQIGTVITNDGSGEPEGVTVQNSYWAETIVPVTQEQLCSAAEHDHLTSGCEAVYGAAECLLEGHPAEGGTFTHGDGTVCIYDAAQGKWLTQVVTGYACGLEAHTHDENCFATTPGYSVWTLTENEQPAEESRQLMLVAAPRAAEEPLPIHFFLASPGNITNPNGSYTNYYGPDKSLTWWPESYAVSGIKQDAAWGTIYSQQGIRNVYDESVITQYVGSWPAGYNSETFKDFGSVRIGGTTYYDTDYEIKWVSVMCRDNDHSDWGMRCSQRTFEGEHIHIDGLLVEKILPGKMEVYKEIPEAQATATTFQFTLQKMLQPDLTSPPASATAIDSSFAPMTLTSTIPAGQTEAQISGGSDISFGYYKLTENSNASWETAGIELTSSSGNVRTIETDTLYICIAPNGTVQYSTTPSGPYTGMSHIAVQNERKGVTVTYQWSIYDKNGTLIDSLPAAVGSHSLPAPATDVKIGTDYVYDTVFAQGTSYHDYENGLLYTFRGWDTYSHSSVYNVNPSVAGYTALDDGDANPANNAKIPITDHTWINGRWDVSELAAADAYLKVHKDVVVSAGGDSAYVNNYLRNTGRMFISIDPGVDKDNDGISQVDVDYPGAVAEGGYTVNVYQYETPFEFIEKNAEVPGYTRTVDVSVSGDNLTLLTENGDSATVDITEEYNPAQAPYNLGTVTYTNTYTKNVGTPVTEYPTLTIVKRATDTGDLQADAVFTLYSDAACTNALQTFTTDEDGLANINFETLLTGTAATYYLRETDAPFGYHVDDTVYTLTLTPTTAEELRGNEFVSVTTYSVSIAIPAGSASQAIQSLADAHNYILRAYNRPILGELTVTKAAVGLAAEDTDLLEATATVHGPITRDAQGQIIALGAEYDLVLNKDNEWSDVLRDLPIGEYLIHEDEASIHGYAWEPGNPNDVNYGALSTEVYNDITSGVFEVDENTTAINVTITNTYEPWEAADFYILKTDPYGEELRGATFQLFTDEACTTKVTDPDIMTVATTGANGLAHFKGFTAGPSETVTYYLKEIEAPAGYYLDDTVYQVEIKAVTTASGTNFESHIHIKDASGAWAENPNFNHSLDILTVINKPVTGSLTIKKVISVDNYPEVLPQGLEEIEVLVSGPDYMKEVILNESNGWTVTLNDLVLGTYTVTEDKANVPGYSFIETYKVGNVETGDAAVVTLSETTPGYTADDAVISGSATITNTYTRKQETFGNPTSFKVLKVDENGDPLPGAEFTLVRARDDHTHTYTTGTSGTVVFDLLNGSIDETTDPPTPVDGIYYLSETAAPDNYVKSEKVWEVKVSEDDGRVRIELNEEKNIFQNFWDWVVGVEDTNWDGQTLTLTVPNERKTGSLTVSKDVTYWLDGEEIGAPNTGLEAAEYSFKLTVLDDNGAKWKEETFSLADGAEKTFDSIPYGYTYEVVENLPANAPYVAVLPDNAEGTIAAEETTVDVENRYTYQIRMPDLTFYKLDSATDQPLAGAKFGLFDSADGETPFDEAVSDANGLVSFLIDGIGIVYLRELAAPEGYKLDETVYQVIISPDYALLTVDNKPVIEARTLTRIEGLEVLSKSDDDVIYTYVFPNELSTLPVDISVSKVWVGKSGTDHPDSVKVTLYCDGKAVETVELSAKNGWKYTWEDLDGSCKWTVDEPNVPAGYNKKVTEKDGAFTITNYLKTVPITGDSADLLLWACVALMAAGAVLALRRKRKPE